MAGSSETAVILRNEHEQPESGMCQSEVNAGVTCILLSLCCRRQAIAVMEHPLTVDIEVMTVLCGMKHNLSPWRASVADAP